MELMVARDDYAKELGHVRFDSNFHFLAYLFGDVCELLSRTSGECSALQGSTWG